MNPSVTSSDEIETLRQEYIREYVDAGTDSAPGDWQELSAPGTIGCHELLDRTSVMMDSVERFVLSHPACLQNKQWFALAHQAVQSLNELYQQVGARHL